VLWLPRSLRQTPARVSLSALQRSSGRNASAAGRQTADVRTAGRRKSDSAEAACMHANTRAARRRRGEGRRSSATGDVGGARRAALPGSPAGALSQAGMGRR